MNIQANINVKSLLYLLLLSTLYLSVFNVSAQKVSITSTSSIPWSSGSSWIGGIAPPSSNISGEDIIINGYVTSNATMNFTTVAMEDKLTITDGGLLVITGGVYFENKSMDIEIEDGGSLIIIGEFSSGNKIEITLGGVMVVVGDMNFGGGQSDFDIGVGNLYVGGDITNNADASAVDQDLENLIDGMGHDDTELYNIITDYTDPNRFTISEISGMTGEDGGAASFTVVLNSEPTNDVSIDLSSDDITEGSVSPSSIVFNSTNWFTEQIVTVQGVDDFLIDGDVLYNITFEPTVSLDSDFNGLNLSDINVTNIDDDVAEVKISSISGSTSEDESTFTFDVVLVSEPIGDVVVNLFSDDISEGDLDISRLTFTSSNWYESQVVTIKGVDDFSIDGDISYNIDLSIDQTLTMDANYNVLVIPSVSVLNLDNDTADVKSSLVSNDTGEDGTRAIFDVELASEPTGDVVINLSCDDTTEGDLSINSLIFNSSNWDKVQEVIITGVDDAIDDGDISYNIDLSIDQTLTMDANYNVLVIPSVNVINLDDETDETVAEILVFPNSGETSEDGDNFVFSVKINTEPNDDVIINVSSSDTREGIVSSSLITFTPVNWLSPQEISVIGQEDFISDGNKDYSIVLSPAVSTDSRYEGIDADDVSLTNTDNDSVGINFSNRSETTDENGLETEFILSLKSQPISDVTVNLMSSDVSEGVLDPSILTFNDLNWDVDQQVKVIGVDDELDDGDITYEIFFSISSLDTLYHELQLASLHLVNQDNESEFIIPAAFSPNGDGKNDEWVISGIDNHPNNKVKIFNRWGNKVYEVDGYNNSSKVWNGQSNVSLHGTGNKSLFTTYYYVIDLRDGSKPKSGNVLVSR